MTYLALTCWLKDRATGFGATFSKTFEGGTGALMTSIIGTLYTKVARSGSIGLAIRPPVREVPSIKSPKFASRNSLPKIDSVAFEGAPTLLNFLQQCM